MSERLGFLGIFGSVTDKHGLRGGLMVTDDRGMPLEIRVATPVKPRKIQRAVYGQSLASHVIGELVATPLLDSLENTPRFVLTNHIHCLETQVHHPLVLVCPAEDMVITGEYESRMLDSFGENRALMIIQRIGLDSLTLDNANALLSGSRRHFEPLEVFMRIDAAMDVLAESDERFR